MAKFIVEIQEVHVVAYEVEGDHISTPEQARAEVRNSGPGSLMIDNSQEFSHLLNEDFRVYDENGDLLLD